MKAYTYGFFLLAIALVVGLNRLTGFDRSIGETHPHITDRALYPKFYVHWVTAVTISWFMWMCGLTTVEIVALMLIAIPAYEWSQRFFNYLDILAGAIGVATALGVIYALT